MKAKYLLNLAVSTTLVAGSFASDAPQAQPAHTPFVTVLLKNFDTWDANHDGTLSPDEIDKVVIDPKVKGDDAAAAGALKLLGRSKTRKLPPLTKDYFTEYDQKELEAMAHRARTGIPAPDAVSATVDTVASPSTTQPTARSARVPIDFDLYFTASKERLAKGGPDRYPGRFILDNTRQGPLGDCFFVASISSMAIRDPNRLEKLIQPEKDGSYVVNLPSTQPIVVPALTDSEVAISGTTAGDGAWLAIMEQAFGKYKSRERGHGDDVEGTEILRTGGDSAPTIQALTGHQTLRFSLGNTVEYRKEHAAEMLPKIRKMLTTNIAEHRLITIGMNPPSRRPGPNGEPPAKLDGTPCPIPPNISINHVYTCYNYDPTTDIIEIWNPHGQHFEPKGTPGIEHGWPTDHGRFKLPLTDACQFYTAFTFELPTPLTAK